jgi:hypothetical protein
VAGNLLRKRIRILAWFLYGLGAFIGLDGLYMQMSGFSQSQGPSVFLFVYNLTMAQDMLFFAIVFGVVATACLIASFLLKGARSQKGSGSRGTGTA